MDEGRDQGLINFEVGEEAVEVQDEGFEAEGGIEAEERLWKITLRKSRVRAIIWESNRTSTLQHPRRDFGEVSTASASAPSSHSRRFFAKALHAGMLVGFAM